MKSVASGYEERGTFWQSARSAQTPMSKHLDLVRYRNDGDDFHILWTARRALRLLEPKSKLVAVAVEGVSEKETNSGAGVDAGLLVIDTTEYYGAQVLDKAEKVIYCQLKYSTTAPDASWNVAGLKGTLKGFADRFRELRKTHDAAFVAQKIRFQFITNRPIAKAVSLVLSSNSPVVRGTTASVRSASEKLRKVTGLSQSEFREFSRLLDLQGWEASRRQQSANLEAEANALLAHIDADASLRMKELVHSKTLSEASNNKTIVRETVLHRLGFVEDDLLPSPPRMERVASEIPRAQEPEIIRTILRSDSPIVIHAAGGIGKSILAQRLPQFLPSGSEAVIFDGFAAGAYRSPRDPRHLHSRGLVHLANTLATRSLCDILLPAKGTSTDAYARAFRRRLAQAALVVRARSPKAVLLVVLDAADNSIIAANERRESCFVLDLLQEAPPEGCRIVALARTERLALLRLPSATVSIPLETFNEKETAEHLRRKYKMATVDAVRRFQRLTDSNPRVQANALADSKNLAELLSALGPRVRTVNSLIKGQLESALARLETEQGVSKDVQSLCTALAILPPLVPIKTLALAAGVPVEAIRSFASDFAGGRPLLIYQGALQFRDEPVETWFRQRFTPSARNFAKIVDVLEPKATTDGYIAAALPQLLLGAGRYSKLVSLALEGAPFTGDDPVEQREVLLRRVRYALKAAISQHQLEDVAKLMTRVGEESATDDRQAHFLIDNADLVSKLASSETVFDFIFRKRAWQLAAGGYAQCAAMLATEQTQRAEAKRFLQLAYQWLRDWAGMSDKNRSQISNQSIADFVFAIILLDGPRHAAEFIAQWKPRTLSFEVGSLVASRLLDAGNVAAVSAWTANAGSDLYLRLGLILELSRVHAVPEEQHVRETVQLLLKTNSKEFYGERNSADLSSGVVALVEFAAHYGFPTTDVQLILKEYRPVHDRPFSHWEKRRDTVLRAATLEAALGGTELGLDDITPTALAGEAKKQTSEHNAELREFRRSYGALLPWYRLRALAIVEKIQKNRWEAVLSAAEKASQPDVSWSSDDRERIGVTNEIPLLWLDAMVWADLTTDRNLTSLRKWLDLQSRVFAVTWTALARGAGHSPNGQTAALVFASRAKDIVVSEHADARQTSDSLIALARAVLSVNQAEAAAYFQLALERLGRVGDEMHDRLYALLAIAKRASGDGRPHSLESYRLARAAEVFEAHNDHDFPWTSVSKAVAALCSASGFALASRWHDRRQTWLGNTLPPIVRVLLERKRLSPSVAVALHVFPGYWGLKDKADHFLDGDLEKQQRQKIFDFLLRDLEFSDRREDGFQGLYSSGQSCRLDCARLTERKAFESAAPAKYAQGFDASFGLPKSRRAKKPQWNRILAQCDLCTPAGIEDAIAKFRSQKPPWEWEHLYSQMRRAVKPRAWISHVQAIENCSVEFWQTLDMLEGVANDWKTSEAVRKSVGAAVKVIIKERPLGLARGRWLSKRDLARCANLGGLSEQEVLLLLTSALAEHVDSVTAGSWFHLAGEIARICLRPPEALRALTFALDRLDPILKDADGDGAWRPELAPPRKMSEAVAGFLFMMLSSPKPEERWRATHAVRRLCALGQQEEVSAGCV